MLILKIIEGWRNQIAPPEELKEVIKEVSSERLVICNDCPFHSKNFKSLRPDAHCTKCSCTLSAKTKCLSCECPEKKWTSVMSSEEENKHKNNKNG